MTQNTSPAVMAQRVEARADALRLGLTHYFTGRPCKNGHIAARLVANWTCSACAKSAQQAVSTERKRAQNVRRYWKDITASRAKGRAARERHLGQRREDDRRRYQNPTRKAWQKKQALAWARANSGKRAALLAAYRAAKKSATPGWLTKAHRHEIRAAYLDAQSRQGEWHVDHIVPLKGKTVCGLHVPWNLQLLPGDENRRKRNTHAE